MNLESQVISLEHAKKLFNLGIKQDSLCYYLNIDGKGIYYIYYADYLPEDFEYEGDPIPAFIASELLNMLPNRITLEEGKPFNSFRLRIEKSFTLEMDPLKYKEMYIVNYYCDSTKVSGEDAWLVRSLFAKNFHSENICNALAECLIKLIEDKLIQWKYTVTN